MNLARYVKENRSKLKNYEWLKQFDENTDGYSFTPLKFQGMKMKYGLDTPPDGIAGDRWMRQHMQTKIMDGVTMEDFQRGFSNAQCNDIINYSAWNAFDILSLRVSEGLSEIIPRAQYEFTAFLRHIARGPEWQKLMIYEVGWKKYMKRMFDAQKDLGAHCTHAGHTWSNVNCHLFGAMAMEALGLVDPDDPVMVEKKYTSIYIWAARAFAIREGDGSLYESQQRYDWTFDQSVVDFLMNNMDPLDDKKMHLFQKLDASAAMLGFDMNYDCRGGCSDRGPHIVEDGKVMIVRTLFINDEEFYWADPCRRRDLPFTIVLAFVVNPEKVGLQEIRINGISTVFSQPANLWPGIEQACMFLRYEQELPEPLPFDKLKKLDWSEVDDLVDQMNDAIFEWYENITMMNTRTKVVNGHQVYCWDSHIGHVLKSLGIWDKYKDLLDYWEWPPCANDAYYQAKGKVATEIMPQRIFTGGGWADIPDKLAKRSRYFDEVLKRERDLGWVSDLSGNKPIPENLKGMFDEYGTFKPNIPFDVKGDEWKK